MKISIFVNGEEYVAVKKGKKVSKQLKDIAEGECFKLADDEEFIVLEQEVGKTIVLRKEPLCNMRFGKNNNFKESDVLDKLKDYQKKIQRIVGERSLKEFCLDLTSLDGLCDYGKIDVKMGVLTLEMARKYVHITDKHKTKEYCWLATPWSTKKHDNDIGVLCVSPFGLIYYDGYSHFDVGVRPLFILDSDIVLS